MVNGRDVPISVEELHEKLLNRENTLSTLTNDNGSSLPITANAVQYNSQIPSELEEEILIRVPHLSLARLKTVCKRWNTLFNDKRFVNKHLALALAHPEVIIATKSNMYSININLNENPTIKVREMTSKIPCLESYIDTNFYHCDGLLLSTWRNGATVWNPWLGQSRWIEAKVELSGLCGIGYDSTRPKKTYKIVGYTYFWRDNYSEVYGRVFIYDFSTNVWKYIDAKYRVNFITRQSLLYNISLNGNLYWIANDLLTGECFIQCLDCSREIFKSFCILPCKNDSFHSHALAVFKENRFSLLEQCQRTRGIEIWVTKNEINNGDDGEDVVWIKFISVSIPEFPILYKSRSIGSSSSYLVDDENIYGKSLVACCKDETRQACIYIVRGDVCKQIKLDFVVDQFCHSVYVPSLIAIPWMSSDQDNNKNLKA